MKFLSLLAALPLLVSSPVEASQRHLNHPHWFPHYHQCVEFYQKHGYTLYNHKLNRYVGLTPQAGCRVWASDAIDMGLIPRT